MKQPTLLTLLIFSLHLPGGDILIAQEPPLNGSVTNTKPYRRWLWWREDHGVEDERQAAFARRKAHEEILRLKRIVPAAVVPGNAWQAIGPAPIRSGQTSPAAPVSGRIADVAIDPSDVNHWLIGGAQGGVWETRDAGLTWSPRTDNAPSLAMGAIAFAPSAPNIVYAGTGEQAFSGDAHDGGGLLKSFDGGTTWQTIEALTFLGTRFGEIKVHPTNPDQLTAATTDGIFKSIDGGAVWSLRRTGTATDLEMHPADFTRQYGALGSTFGSANNDAYRSLDAGETWVALNGPWKALGSVGRIEMALAPSAPDLLYVSVHNTSDGRCLGVWRTDNAWAATPAWTVLPLPVSGTGNMWYNHDLSVHPANPAILYLAATSLLKFENGTWFDILATMHVDIHSLAWAGNRLVVGNDGGCWSSLDAGNTYLNHNTNLQLTQFYHGAIHPTNPNRALGGSQDNGTARWDGPAASWELEIGGDGADCAFSRTNPDLHWAASFQDLSIQRTRNGGSSWSGADGGIEDSNRPFIGAFTIANHNSDIFITGTHRVYKCVDFFSATTPTWFTNSMDLAASLRAYAFAESDPTDNTYCVGTAGGTTVLLTTNGGVSWESLDPANTLPNRTTRAFAFNPTNANLLYTTLSGFSGGSPQCVYVCTNALAATPRWRNISPPVDIPALALAVDADDPNILYVGTDLGVWRSANAGTNWTHMGPETGLPNVEIDELKLSNASGRLVAFTHGRGAYALYTSILANLAILQTVSPTNAAIGCALTYSLFVTNSGPLHATNVFVTNQLPANATFASAQTPVGTFTQSGARVVFALGVLGAGDAYSLTVRATATALGTATNTALVRADQIDPMLMDNTAQTVVPIALDTTIPGFLSSLASTNGSEVYLNFNEAIDGSILNPAHFLVTDGLLRPLAVTATRFGPTPAQVILSVNLLAGIPPYRVSFGAFADCAGNTQPAGTNRTMQLPSQILISRGSVWRYLDDGSNQGTAWRERSFDDAAWLAGPARFGYGGDGEVTAVNFGPDPTNKFVTTYFRRIFVVSNPAIFSSLSVNLTRDDGAAVYLNGTEVRRDNLAAGAAFNTLATSTINGVDETTFTPLAASVAALRAGTNVIAVEVHQVSLTSSDLGFDLELTGSAPTRADLLDNDLDGMPNAWETANGFSANTRADADQDADGDGLTNFEEYFAGTRPRDTNSFLRLDATAGDSGGVTLQFLAVSNRCYTVLRRGGVEGGPWFKLADFPAVSTNRLATWLDTNAPPVQFYRLTTPTLP